MRFITVRSERRRYVCAYWVRRHRIVIAHGPYALEIDGRGVPAARAAQTAAIALIRRLREHGLADALM